LLYSHLHVQEKGNNDHSEEREKKEESPADLEKNKRVSGFPQDSQRTLPWMLAWNGNAGTSETAGMHPEKPGGRVHRSV
jgi:hypothetical protein